MRASEARRSCSPTTRCLRTGSTRRCSPLPERRYGDRLPLGQDGLPYSKGLMARALITAGVTAERAYELARRIELDLAERNARVMELERVRELAHGVLGQSAGDQAVDRLRRVQELHQLDMPIVILVGGATGTGKSTVATEVAHRLGITRVTSTDVVRQTMRAFFPAEFMPSIHYSSFEAGKAVSRVEGDKRDPNLTGFLDQTRNVLVGVHAVLARALEEGYSLALEGVHIVPGMVSPPGGALVCQVLLAIEDEADHEGHFWTR